MKELRKEIEKAQKELNEIRKELKGRKPGQERM